MRKLPQSQTANLVRKGAAILFALEVTVFAGVYHVYHRMNSDRDYRYYMKNNYNFCLEAFYSVGEFMNSKDKTRHFDKSIWALQSQAQSGSTKNTEQ